MRSALSTLEVARPRDLAHALKQLHASLASERLTPLAGGTDVFVTLNAGSHAGTRFLDLSPLRELRGVRVTTRGLVLGALATFAEIEAAPPVRRGWPTLAAAARVVGAAQIQNRATLGGNIANASPAGDSLPVLLAHDAVVVAASVRGERRLPFAELFRGYRSLALEADELITAIEIGRAPRGAASFFRKVGTRAAQSISKVVLAGVFRASRDGVFDHVRLAFGSVAPTPLRAFGAEAALLGARPSATVAAAAMAALESDLSPIDDIRSDAAYRRSVSRALLGHALRAANLLGAR